MEEHSFWDARLLSWWHLLLKERALLSHTSTRGLCGSLAGLVLRKRREILLLGAEWFPRLFVRQGQTPAWPGSPGIPKKAPGGILSKRSTCSQNCWCLGCR